MPDKPTVTIHHLTNEDIASFPGAARLLDAMSQLHTAKVSEVFDGSQPTKTASYVAELVAEPKNQVYVATNGKEVVGVLRSSIQEAEDIPGWRVRRYGTIEAMFVEPKWRRQGIAGALMQAATLYFKEQGLAIIELNVWDFNKEAQSLYRKLGFRAKNLNMWRKL
jgi:ribosomal protein S18 acetylase RimI-like enzyme